MPQPNRIRDTRGGHVYYTKHPWVTRDFDLSGRNCIQRAKAPSIGGEKGAVWPLNTDMHLQPAAKLASIVKKGVRQHMARTLFALQQRLPTEPMPTHCAGGQREDQYHSMLLCSMVIPDYTILPK